MNEYLRIMAISPLLMSTCMHHEYHDLCHDLCHGMYREYYDLYHGMSIVSFLCLVSG